MMLEKRLYKIVLITATVLSLISILGNLISNFPLPINIKWLVLASVSIFSLISLEKGYFKSSSKVIFFIFLILVFIPLGYMDSGGGNNNTIAYVFLILIVIVFLFKGYLRLGFVSLLIISTSFMHYVEYHYPELIKVYSEESQFMDRMIQIPLLLMVSYLIIMSFTKEHEKNKISLETLNKKLNDLVNIDVSTGLYNCRYFDLRVTELDLLEDNNRYVVIFDIDQFKQINDGLGHLIGDEVLKKFAQVASKTIKDEDVFARWGGDEFALIFHGDKNGLIQLLSKLVTCYRKVADEFEITTSLSFGASSWKCKNCFDEVLKKADLALYEAKESTEAKMVIND